MRGRAADPGRGWQLWLGAVLASAALHSLILGAALLWPRELPLRKRVVPVEAICLTAGSGHAGGGSGQVCAIKPQAPPQPPPPRPRPVRQKPKPRHRRERPAPRPPEVEPRPALALPKSAAATPACPKPQAAVSPGSGSGQGAGAGNSQGTGRGQGAGTGAGRGSGAGTDPGAGRGAVAALQSYLAQVRRLLEQHKDYPGSARWQQRQGVAVLKFTINLDGGIAGQAIVRSSGHELLDAAARETLRKVGHFPPLPAALGRSRLTIQVPLSFRLDES